MKKWMLTSVSVLLTAGFLTACMSISKSTYSGTDGGSYDSGTKTVQDDMKEKLEINIMTISYEGGGWPDHHPMIDYLNKKFNVDLKFQWIPSDNYDEKLNVLAASGSFPDAFTTTGGEFLKWRDKGVFLDVKPMISRYPNLLKNLGGEQSLQFMSPKGKYFGLPYYAIDTRDSFGIRQDWLDKLGLKLPTTMDQFYNVAKLFVTQDPDGDGKSDTIGFSTSLTPTKDDFDHIDDIKAAFGLVNGWGLKDGKIISWHTQNKELKDFASFMHKAYVEGVLDKDFAVNKTKDPQEKYSANKVGIMDVVPTNYYQTYDVNLKKLAPKAVTAQLLPPKGPNGQQGTKTSMGTQKLVINSKIDPKKQERLLKMFDYFVSDEGNIMTKNGIEGVHYKKDGDKYSKLDAFAGDRPYIISTWLLRRFDPDIQIRLWDDQEMVNKVNQWFTNNAPFKWPNTSVGLESATYNKLGITIDQKFMAALVKVIIGELPIDTIDQAVDQWKKDGGDTITKEYNDAYQKLQ
ncbi:type 2 periplasmic-binding domain-containing protein [Paenibacillus aestuarii]|uniref:Extracellular solute-binding protein n=1 Tax=Paenibacillus aestuarii TaxID=516965 RepID=A0ABW0KFQ5_9BACL|nr:extracellular solute-binding protein [Paenibacillus aestuarii]